MVHSYRVLSCSLALSLLAFAAPDAAAGGGRDALRADPGARVTLAGAQVAGVRGAEVHVTASAQASATDAARARRVVSTSADVRFTVGVQSGDPLWQALSTILHGMAGPVAASVVTAAGEYELKDTVVSEITFPALDSAAATPFAVGVSLRSSQVSRRPPAAGATRSASGTRTKAAMASSFRLTLGDLDATRVRAIDPFAIKLADPSAVGLSRVERRVTTALAPTTVSIYLSATAPGADRWLGWFDELAAGKASAKSGSLELLAPNVKTVALAIDLQSVTVAAIHDVVVNERREIKVDLVVGQMSLGGKAAPVKAP
ncbi:MAG TPA: hypothetical protein VMZ28_05750 [Kofleriaceae bacterium]|nr:hypothetical protein [Kofleriaceae bacterium]